MLLKQITIKKIILILSISVFSNTVFADRIKDFADIAGQRPNQLVGYGLVVGLDGTGDQTTQTPFTLQSVLQMIGVLGVTLPSTGTQAQLRNTAAIANSDWANAKSKSVPRFCIASSARFFASSAFASSRSCPRIAVSASTVTRSG